MEGRQEEKRRNNRKILSKGNSTYFILDECEILDEQYASRKKKNRKKKALARNPNYTTLSDKVTKKPLKDAI